MFLKQALCFTTCWLTLLNGIWNKIASIAREEVLTDGLTRQLLDGVVVLAAVAKRRGETTELIAIGSAAYLVVVTTLVRSHCPELALDLWLLWPPVLPTPPGGSGPTQSTRPRQPQNPAAEQSDSPRTAAPEICTIR